MANFFLLQVSFYIFSIIAILISRAGISIKLLSLLASFLVGNVGLMLGILSYLAGNKIKSY